MPDDDAPQRGRQDEGGFRVAQAFGKGLSERSRVLGMLQDERALEVPGAVKARRQPEMPFEKRAGSAEEIEQLVAGHEEVRRSGSIPSRWGTNGLPAPL